MFNIEKDFLSLNLWFLVFSEDVHCLVHSGVRDKRRGFEIDMSRTPGVRDKRRVYEIDLFQPKHETAFLVTSQWASDVTINDPIKWLNYPLEGNDPCRQLIMNPNFNGR